MNKLRRYLTGKNLYSIFLHIVVVILAVEVVILARQNGDLKGRVAYDSWTIGVGDHLETDNMLPLDSTQVLPTKWYRLVFVFTTTCTFCKLNLDRWEEIT